MNNVGDLQDAIDHVKTWMQCSTLADSSPSLLATRIAMVIKAAERCDDHCRMIREKNKLIESLVDELLKLKKKVAHGCTDMTCVECDKENQ